VNMSARMESYGIPGLVQVSASTRELLDDTFPLTMRTVDVKGKGVVATYLVDPANAPLFYHRPAEMVGVEADAPALPSAQDQLRTAEGLASA
jgi:Adenylate and Guanylate cyclase catalytic domain